MIAYTPRGPDYRVRRLADGSTLYPTRSFHRIGFLPDLVRLLPVGMDGWKPDIISPQGPWGEGTLAFLLSRWLGAGTCRNSMGTSSRLAGAGSTG